ncbi:MAG TPA: reverse transcriptase family protein, partial [Nitrososphaeraceae archaeon]|nr:reverse transcriptase family protein [Nitrososphaeraceae archaeon]
FLGDFNINLLDESYSNALSDFMHCRGYESLINVATRFGGDSSSCLDHLWVYGLYGRQGGFTVKYKLNDLLELDHMAVLVDVNFCENINYKSNQIEILDWEKVDELVLSHNWENVYKEENGDKSCRELVGNIIKILKTATKTLHIRNKGRKRAPWANDTLVQLSNEKSRVYKLCKKCPHNHEFKKQLKFITKETQKLTRSLKRSYYNDLLSGFNNDPKKYWGLLNKLSGRNKESITSIDMNGIPLVVAENKEKIANVFNTYFINSVQDVNDRFEDPLTPVFDVVDKMSDNTLSCLELNISDVERGIDELSNKKSTGIDNIPGSLLKRHKTELGPVLLDVFNKSLQDGIFPECFKLSVVVPVYKAKERDKVENYRPISLLSTVSKVFEIIIKMKMLAFLNKQNFFNNFQYGFIPKKGTEDILVDFVYEVSNNLEMGFQVSSIFLDIRKAFDTVDHNILLYKLKDAGFEGEMLSWFKSYLIGRKQVVKIEGIHSKECMISSGVPQGSVLGPLLFVIFVNDLGKLELFGKLFAFADDTAIVYRAKSKDILSRCMNSDLIKISNWYYKNKLSINISKSNYMIFNFKENYEPDVDIRLHSSPECGDGICSPECGTLQRVMETKYLGVVIDQGLTWASQCCKIRAELRKINYLLYYLSQFLSAVHLRRVYVSIFESKLRYGLIVWGSAAKQHISQIKVLQNWAVRTITFSKKRDSAEQLFIKLKLLDFQKLCVSINTNYINKNKMKFNVQQVEKRTRLKSKILAEVPKFNKYHTRMQFPFVGPTMYNELGDSIKTSKNFKGEIRKYLLNLH